MDSQIKKRMVNKVTLHPFEKYKSGDKYFGEPIELSCIIIPHVGRIVDNLGDYHVLSNKLILEPCGEHDITNNDEIEIKNIGRVPIKSVASYNSLKKGTELLEIYC